MHVLVRDNNVEQALKVLKKKMQREGIFREMKMRKAYEKPSEKKVREKAESVRRARKLARKQAQREGLLPGPKKKMLERLHGSDEDLIGKQVLVVDDDVRNIFALSSVLERRGMHVLTANTGREAIFTLEERPDVSIVLMDIMMPEMDGYETMREIRQKPAYNRLPIIALTAKAMKGDREKCLQAGASDYLAKPVNTEQLMSALRMWLHR